MVNTYPEMNQKIVGILRIDGENQIDLYAAQRIEELESSVKELVDALEQTLSAIESHNKIKGNAYGHYHDVLADGKLLLAKHKEVQHGIT